MYIGVCLQERRPSGYTMGRVALRNTRASLMGVLSMFPLATNLTLPTDVRVGHLTVPPVTTRVRGIPVAGGIGCCGCIPYTGPRDKDTRGWQGEPTTHPRDQATAMHRQTHRSSQTYSNCIRSIPLTPTSFCPPPLPCNTIRRTPHSAQHTPTTHETPHPTW